MNLLLRLQKNLGKASLALLTLLLLGCSTTSSTTQTDQATAPYTAHVAFAGGGWRAHTGHSAWVMSLLDNGNKTLDQVFNNVGTISSNSGGSWFNTMLVYSGDFVKAIQGPNAINTWANSDKYATGWLGQQQYLFDQTHCHGVSGTAFLACVSWHYTGTVSKALNWKKMIEAIVYRNNTINQSLNGTRQAWAKDKSLLLAATMLTTEAVLSSVDSEKQYYQACRSPSKPIMKAHAGAFCSNQAPPIPDVTPVTMASIPSGSGLTAPSFFSALDRSHYFNVSYTENALLFTPKVYNTLIGNPITVDNVPVITAASASSAAGGYGASAEVTGHWEESYVILDEALSFQLDKSMTYQNASGLSAETLAAKKIVQIADGGAVDNSGVAQLVRFLQLNNQADGFNIVAFDNSQQSYPFKGETAAGEVGVAIANLFGKTISTQNKICMGSHCVNTPKLKIFDTKALNNTPITWQAIDTNYKPSAPKHKLIYTKYTVTTTDNSAFGIKAGSTGTLHAFTAVWPDAHTAPENNSQDADFKAYGAMLKFINTGLQQTYKGETGISHLKKAMGIK